MMKLDIQMFADGGKVVIPIEADTKSFEEQIRQTEKKLRELESSYEKASKVSGKLKPNEQAMANLRKEIEKTRNTLIDLKTKQENLKGDYEKIGFPLKDIVSKVTRWGMAIFGVRSAYMAIRQAMSTLSSENEQIATDIEYMRWILAQTLKPVVEWIIKGLYLILTLVNMVSVALFRYNFLAGKGADQFKKMKKSTGGIASDLKEARKQLSSFDEMNILADNVKASGGGGGIPSGIDEWEMPEFSTMEQKIKDFMDKWRRFGEEMKQSLYKMPFSKWTDAFGQWDLAIYGVTQTVHGLWGMITNMIGFVTGIIQTIHGLITGNTDEIEKGITNTIKSIIGWIKSTIEVITGVGNVIKGIIKGILMTIWGWLFDGIDRATQKFNSFRDKVVGTFSDIATKIKTKITEIQNFLTEKFGFFGTVIGTVVGGAFKGAVNFALTSIERILNTPINAINGLIGQVSKLGIKITPLKTFKFPRLAQGGIINMPGRGVPVGTAIGGERGAEGVIPLTDSQQMALLGEAIGKFVNINATIPVYVGNRQIARELRKINAEDDFARNS